MTRVPVKKTPFITNISAVSNDASVNKKDGRDQDQRQNVGGQEESAGMFGDSRIGLIAALVFGVLFLIIMVAMLSKQLIDSYKRKDYTKMDFLMNGMYVEA